MSEILFRGKQTGRWLINSDGYYPYCSECKEEPKSGIMTHYCPNCGAKMDKGGADGRLIDETAYQEAIAKIPMNERTFVKAWETAQDMPTVDAVEVVRCKNCAEYNRCTYDGELIGGSCSIAKNVSREPDDYCSRGIWG